MAPGIQWSKLNDLWTVELVSGPFFFRFLRRIMLMTRIEQLFAQMCRASLRTSRSPCFRLAIVVGEKLEIATFNTCKYWRLAKLLLQGRSVDSAQLAPGHAADRWTGRAGVSVAFVAKASETKC